MTGQSHRYLLLDAMRGVAAMAVVWGHLMDSWGRTELEGQDYILAVDFFFILSGFVIGHAYAKRLKTGMSGVEFSLVRIIRLYPLLILGALFGTVVMLAHHGGEPGYAPAVVLGSGGLAALGLPTFLMITQLGFPINGPAWSLFFELAANFVYAFIGRFMNVAILALITIAGALALIHFAHVHNSIEIGWQKDHLLDGSTRVIFGFFAGLLLHELRPRREMPSWLGYALMAILASVLFQPFNSNVQMQLVLAIGLFPAIVWLGSAVRTSPLITRLGATFGALSYPIYILHWPFIDLTRTLFLKVDPTGQWMIPCILLQIAIILAVAIIGMKLFDEPVRARLMRALKSARQRSSAKDHAPST